MKINHDSKIQTLSTHRERCYFPPKIRTLFSNEVTRLQVWSWLALSGTDLHNQAMQWESLGEKREIKKEKKNAVTGQTSRSVTWTLNTAIKLWLEVLLSAGSPELRQSRY